MIPFKTFARWLASDVKEIEYHRGNLMVERGPDYKPTPLRLTAADLARAEEGAGTIMLFQRRLGPDEFAYFARKRRIPRRKWRLVS